MSVADDDYQDYHEFYGYDWITTIYFFVGGWPAAFVLSMSWMAGLD